MFVSRRAVASVALLVTTTGGVSGFGVVNPTRATRTCQSSSSSTKSFLTPFSSPTTQHQTSATTTKTRTTTTTTTTTTSLFGIRCENKYYQLEEMEDKDNSTTELFLTEEGGVEFGDTDGPVWIEAAGRWQVEPDTDNFKMVIVRKFSTGRDSSDMGEFEYEIGRTYMGEMTKVGDSVGITGVMHSQPEPVFNGEIDQEIGFFNMIDGTDSRSDKRPDARSGVVSN